MCSGLISSCAVHFVSQASVQNRGSEAEAPHGSALLQETTTGPGVNPGPLISQTQLLAWLPKSFSSTPWGCPHRGRCPWHPHRLAAPLSSSCTPSVALRWERTGVNWHHAGVAIVFRSQLLHCVFQDDFKLCIVQSLYSLLVFCSALGSWVSVDGTSALLSHSHSHPWRR